MGLENLFEKHWNSKRDDYSDRPSILFQEDHISFLDDCKSILDLGCGSGQLVKKLNDAGKEAYGITYNSKEVGNKLHKNVMHGDMHNISFHDNLFDAFVMWDSLEHCQSAYIALCEARRVLKPSGKGLIFMPGQNWLNCHCHIVVYTIEQMKQLFKQAQLRLINVYEKKYKDKNIYCEGMAVYEVIKDINYKAVFEN